ncbi:MAG: hypothetical protein HY223_00195 [Thaumarchaeota archaeon]|nr:hypothetical protein [Nitrososphaerota archaeon]
MTDAGNEQHLAKLLQSFNRNMYLSYVQKAEKIISDCSEDSTCSKVNAIRTPDGVGDLAFRISFGYPVYIMLSHPICKFKSHRNYPIREGLFIANLGLVPVFFSSLNIMTVLKLWGDRAESFFNPVNSPLADTEVICWELPETSRSMDYSSMNFILQHLSEPEAADAKITEIYEKYFRLGYWSFPKHGFSPSTHFLHGRTSISSQVKIAKSLYIIEEIGRLQTFPMEGKIIEAVSVTLGGLAEKNGEYFFVHFSAFMDIEIANKVLPKDNLEKSFVNGIVAEITGKGQRLSLMTVVADYGESYFDILASLIGIIADKKYSSNDLVADIGTVDELRESVFNLYLDIYRKLQVPRTLSESISNSFDFALNSMFPILITEEQKVKLVHPLTWGFLKKWNLVTEDNKEQKEILIHLFKIIDRSGTTGFSRIFLDDNAEFFSKKGINKYTFAKAIFHLVKDIRLCKMMRKILEI